MYIYLKKDADMKKIAMIMLACGLGVATFANATHKVRFENNRKKEYLYIDFQPKAGRGRLTRCLAPKSKIDINFSPDDYEYVDLSLKDGKACSFEIFGTKKRRFPYVDKIMAMGRAMTPAHLIPKGGWESLKNLHRVWADEDFGIQIQGKD